MESQLKETKIDKATLEERIKELTQKLERTEQSLLSQQSQTSDLEEKLQKEVEEKEKLIKDLQNKCRESQVKASTMESQLKEAKQEKTTLEERYEGLTRKLESTEQSLLSQQIQTIDLKEKLRSKVEADEKLIMKGMNKEGESSEKGHQQNEHLQTKFETGVSIFSTYLLRLAQKIGKEDLDNILFISKDEDINKREGELIKNPLDLFRKLQDIGCLDKENGDVLVHFLNAVNLRHLAMEVKVRYEIGFEKDISDTDLMERVRSKMRELEQAKGQAAQSPVEPSPSAARSSALCETCRSQFRSLQNQNEKEEEEEEEEEENPRSNYADANYFSMYCLLKAIEQRDAGEIRREYYTKEIVNLQDQYKKAQENARNIQSRAFQDRDAAEIRREYYTKEIANLQDHYKKAQENAKHLNAGAIEQGEAAEIQREYYEKEIANLQEQYEKAQESSKTLKARVVIFSKLESFKPAAAEVHKQLCALFQKSGVEVVFYEDYKKASENVPVTFMVVIDSRQTRTLITPERGDRNVDHVVELAKLEKETSPKGNNLFISHSKELGEEEHVAKQWIQSWKFNDTTAYDLVLKGRCFSINESYNKKQEEMLRQFFQWVPITPDVRVNASTIVIGNKCKEQVSNLFSKNPFYRQLPTDGSEDEAQYGYFSFTPKGKEPAIHVDFNTSLNEVKVCESNDFPIALVSQLKDLNTTTYGTYGTTSSKKKRPCYDNALLSCHCSKCYKILMQHRNEVKAIMKKEAVDVKNDVIPVVSENQSASVSDDAWKYIIKVTRKTKQKSIEEGEMDAKSLVQASILIACLYKKSNRLTRMRRILRDEQITATLNCLCPCASNGST
ncbi:restin homolog [Ptychodera flava]|uniref:restin homolog n=1 Tax=Ptychodera flava TaxID=63121 RepID=UPI003969BF9B